jgi:iron complex transport system substrate-binding protein
MRRKQAYEGENYKMTRAKLISLIAITSALFLTSIIFQNPLVCGAPKTRIITDMTGRKIVVPDPLTRVALLGGPTGQIAYILGARNQLCAVTQSLKTSELIHMMDPSVKDLVAPRSTSGQINVEELIVSNPQLVIAGDLDGSIVEKKTRIPVAFLKSTMNLSHDHLKAEIRFYGMVFGKESRAEKYVLYLQKITDLVQSRTRDIPQNKRKVVFNGYSSNHLVTLGGDTFMQRQIELAGCRNATEKILSSGTREGGLHSGLAEVSMEKVLGWNPDILVIDFGSPSDLYSDPKWKSISAVKNSMIFKQPIGIFIWDRPTAESAVLHPLWLAKMAYPDRFADIDLTQEIKQFYREIMSFNLTNDQAEAILSAKFTLSFANRGFGKAGK